MGTLTGHGRGLGASRRELELGGLSNSGQAATGPVPGLGKPRCLCSWGLSCRGPGLQSALLTLWMGDGTGLLPEHRTEQDFPLIPCVIAISSPLQKTNHGVQAVVPLPWDSPPCVTVGSCVSHQSRLG